MTNVAPSFIDSLVLNPVQKEAVIYTGGPELVFAGAGTGKTRVLTSKIAYLIKECRIMPGQIFAATFTNKAASEMKTRVEGLIGISCDGLWIGTFHSLCVRILRREASKIGYTSNFTIYDADDQISLIKKVIKELDLDERVMAPRNVQHVISRCKNAGVSADEFAGTAKNFFDEQYARVYTTYQQKLKQHMAMDFDDLLTNTVYLFRDSEQTLASYQNIFKWVLVDEYQDTNITQFNLVKLLALRHQNIFTVGDDDQSIYGWRGAVIENILSFEHSFTNTKTFRLEQNYRSTNPILNFANAAIVRNTKRAQKKLWTARNGGGDIIVTRYYDDRQEADIVSDKISKLTSGGTLCGDICVLYRTNAQSRVFEDALRKRKIPYLLVGGLSFYERKEIKDCMAYLRLLVNPDDNISFERIINVPARGIGDKTLLVIVDQAKQKRCSLLRLILSGQIPDLSAKAQKSILDLKETYTYLIDQCNNGSSPYAVLNDMLKRTGYMDMLQTEQSEDSESRIDNINELLNVLSNWGRSNAGRPLADFLEEMTLASDVDRWEHADSAVNLMTMHCSKGLEFKAVFLVGLEDGIIPSRQNFDDMEKVDEECRLLYVGITRAREALECSHVTQRWRFGSLTPMGPSRFLADISSDLYTGIDLTSVMSKDDDLPEIFKPRERRTDFRMSGVAPAKKTMAVPQRTFQSQPVFEDFTQETVQYRLGQRVTHKMHGVGKIVGLNGFGPDLRLIVLFNDGVRRKLIAKFAQLEV